MLAVRPWRKIAAVNEMVTERIILLILCALFFARGIRIFLRSGLKGELIRTAGIILFLISYFIHNYLLAIAAFVIFNIGWLILATFENDARREIYKNTTVFNRLIGNIPKIIPRKAAPSTYDRTVGLLTGIICLLLAFILYKRIMPHESIQITFISVLAFGGIFFIVYSLFRRT
jgi:hypothetical protein